MSYKKLTKSTLKDEMEDIKNPGVPKLGGQAKPAGAPTPVVAEPIMKQFKLPGAPSMQTNLRKNPKEYFGKLKQRLM